MDYVNQIARSALQYAYLLLVFMIAFAIVQWAIPNPSELFLGSVLLALFISYLAITRYNLVTKYG